VWAFARPNSAPLLNSIDQLLRLEISAIDFDYDCARQFGSLRFALRRKGVEVNTVDLMIASVALVYDLTLVTHNIIDFQNVPGLRVEDWLTP
jgi:tRNA(fMet)-specific endonuclease VapC